MKTTLTFFALLLLAPLASIGNAKEPFQEGPKTNPDPAAKSESTDNGKKQEQSYNILMIAVDDLNLNRLIQFSHGHLGSPGESALDTAHQTELTTLRKPLPDSQIEPSTSFHAEPH